MKTQKIIIITVFLTAVFSTSSVAAVTNQVSITSDAEYRYIKSNGIPLTHGEFPNAGNPNTIEPQDYNFRMPLHPVMADKITPLQNSMNFGVAMDGVPFDPGTAEFWQGDRNWRYEALSGKIDLGMDQNHAHVQPNGAYHYHGIPTDLLTDEDLNRGMKMVGFAADGFPIYANDPNSGIETIKSSYKLRPGARVGGPGGSYDGTYTADYMYVAGSGDLDECNGRFGATPEEPNGTYYYFITKDFPIIPRCFKGTPDPSFEKAMGPPPGGPGHEDHGPHPDDLPPPPPPGGGPDGEFPPPPPPVARDSDG